MGVFSPNDSQLVGTVFATFTFYCFERIISSIHEKSKLKVRDNPLAGAMSRKREQNAEHIFNYFRVGNQHHFQFRTKSQFMLIPLHFDSDFFDETMLAYGGKSGQMLEFNPEELTARHERTKWRNVII